MQCVGETALKLNHQFNRHVTTLCHPKKHIHCRILSGRFTLGKCGGAKYTNQIIKKLKGNGRTSRNIPENKVTQTCKAKETHWMKKLRKVYPYGLNNLASDDFKTALGIYFIGVKFPSLKRVHIRQPKGTLHQRINQVN